MRNDSGGGMAQMRHERELSDSYVMQRFIKFCFYKLGYSVKRLRSSGAMRNVASIDGAGRDPMTLLHAVNPYEGFDHTLYPDDRHGWGGDSPAFRELITALRPALIIEVGTWKGASALEMADILKELGIPGRIICIDTWLGALEFWCDQSDPDRFGSLKLRHGFPTVYYQFLANVCHQGSQDCIIPFPQTSATGALWLRCHGITSPLVYIDASHEEEDVFSDLVDYWEIVAPGGVLFGDDWSWDGVRLAVERFAARVSVPISFNADKWMLKKP